MKQEGELNMLIHVSGKPYSAVQQQRSPRHREVRRNLSQCIKGKQTSQPRRRLLGVSGGERGREEVTHFDLAPTPVGNLQVLMKQDKFQNKSLQISHLENIMAVSVNH